MAKQDKLSAQIYAIARAAEWAGDLDFSRVMYAEFSGPSQYLLFPERFDGPMDVIRFVSALRAARLNEPTMSRETRSLAEKVFSVERLERKSFAAPEPMPLLPTAHLRAVVHRTGERDFEMRGYMTSADFDQSLYANARKLAATRKLELAEEDTQSSPTSYGSPAGTWVIEGTLFQQVSVSDLGLIKSRGQWTRKELPSDSDAILSPFQVLLDALDPSDMSASIQGV